MHRRDRPRSEPTPRLYQCPGEPYTIQRAIHLARLASGYLPCRQCALQDDRGPESAGRRRQIAAALAGPAPWSGAIPQALQGLDLDAWTPTLAGELGLAWAAAMRADSPGGAPRAVVASDGQPYLQPLMEAIVSRLRWAGCHVFQLEPTTAPTAVMAIDHLQAAGGLYLGAGGAGTTHELAASLVRLVRLKLWWPGTRPASATAVATIDARRGTLLDRPARRMGSYRRLQFAEEYLQELRGAWHGLRPLRFLTQGASSALERFLAELTGQVACRTVPFEGRPAGFPEAICAQGAHFGIRFLDQGEIASFLDEAGRPVDPQSVFLAIASQGLRRQPGGLIVVDTAFHPDAAACLDRLPARVLRIEPDCFAVAAAMLTHDAILGYGPEGRIWYPSGYAACDALRTLTAVVGLLNQSDRPFSAVFPRSSSASA